MARSKTYTFTLIVLTVVFCLSAPQVSARVVKSYDKSVGCRDLFLLGFGELTFHSLNIRGNTEAFEAGNPWLKHRFSTNYRTSLFANGNLTRKFFINASTIVDSRIDDEYRAADPSVYRLRMSLESTEPLWDGWRFTGEGVYDPHRLWEFGNLDTRLLTQPQESVRLEMMMRLESDKHGYIEGGSLRPSFKNSQFTMRNRSLFGMFADLNTKSAGVEAVAGKLEGKSFQEGTVIGIRANGTVGPFDLSQAPVTRGSEEIRIEERDRFDESTVLSTQLLTRDIDYSVDYERGRIMLHLPVASETTESNPVYIVIAYDYQRTHNDEIIGSRIRLVPGGGLRSSVSYLHRRLDDEAYGPGLDEPEDLYAIDASLELGDYGTGEIEIAGSQNPEHGEGNQALRVGWQFEPLEKLDFAADFQRIDDQFRSFTNSELNPVKNQQRIHIKSNYRLTGQQDVSIYFGDHRTLAVNGQYNPYPGQRNEKTYRAGYHNHSLGGFDFGMKLERRDVVDMDDPAHEDNRQHRAIVDLSGMRGEFGLLGRFDYGCHYEFIAFRNRLEIGTSNTNTNLVSINLSSRPVDGTRIDFTQKLRVSANRDLGSYDDREDATFARIRLQPYKHASSLATMEYKRFTVPGTSLSLRQDDAYRIDWAGTWALEYLPHERIKALGRLGYYTTERRLILTTTRTTDDFLLGQFTYYANHHLSFRGESEYRRTVREMDGTHRSRTWDLGLRMNWNRDRLHELTAGIIRRQQTDYNPPVAEMKSTSYILLLSGSVGLGRGFYAQVSVKDLLLRDLIDDEKTHTQLEIGYENRHWYRFSFGYERIESDADAFPDRYYRGHGLFVRLAGKL